MQDTLILQRSVPVGIIKRWSLLFVLFVFALFGLIHLLEVSTGRAQRMFWNPNVYDPTLADWSKPGFLGVDLKHYTTRDVVPIPCHSHNDYQRQAPLYDAISWGCTSVEADVWLLDGELYVAHEASQIDQNRTLRSLYINPLVGLLDRKAKDCGVFDTNPNQTLVLLIDFKTGGEETFTMVQQHLEPLRQQDQLSYWNGTSTTLKAVTVVATGDAPFENILKLGTGRDIFYDAPLQEFRQQQIEHDSHAPTTEASLRNDLTTITSEDIQSLADDTSDEKHSSCRSDKFNASTSYYASTKFRSQFGSLLRGHFSPKQMILLRRQVEEAQRCGLKVRYWGTPSWPVSLRNYVWDTLIKEGVDMLNVDDLKAAAALEWNFKSHTLWL